jgi:hypothetical protein
MVSKDTDAKLMFFDPTWLGKVIFYGLVAVCYCSYLFRPMLYPYPKVLWWAGFLPSFGAGLGGPLVLLYGRRHILHRMDGEKRWFLKVCAACLLYLLVHECMDSTNLRPERVFDWCDVGASVVGCVAALVVWNFEK